MDLFKVVVGFWVVAILLVVIALNIENNDDRTWYYIGALVSFIIGCTIQYFANVRQRFLNTRKGIDSLQNAIDEKDTSKKWLWLYDFFKQMGPVRNTYDPFNVKKPI